MIAWVQLKSICFESGVYKMNRKKRMYTKEERQKIYKAYMKAKELHQGQKRKSGEEYFIHPKAVGKLLIEMGEDADTICAGLLHDTVEDTSYTLDELTKEFGQTIAFLVDGVTKIRQFSKSNKQKNDLETIKKIIVYCAKDIRILKIKLADRIHNMRTLEFQKIESQRRIAQETLNIYAPLAKFIGAYHIKHELEDLSLKYLEPQKYEDALKARTKIKNAYANELNKIKKVIVAKLLKAGINNRVEIRFCNTYSLYLHTNKEQNPFIENLTDLISVKIIIPDNYDPNLCFYVTSFITELWKTKSSIHNYIHNSKPNGYESIHIEAFTRIPFPILFKIRTEKMDKIAKYGIPSQTFNQEKWDMKNILENFVSLSKEEEASKFVNSLEESLLNKKITIYTADGTLQTIPRNSTLLDYVYAFYPPKIADYVKGGYVNGINVAPQTVLQDGDTIEIIPSQELRVTDEAWLSKVKTPIVRKRLKELGAKS